MVLTTARLMYTRCKSEKKDKIKDGKDGSKKDGRGKFSFIYFDNFVEFILHMLLCGVFVIS